MAIPVSCPSCRTSLEFDESNANMQGSCPKCGTAFMIPPAGGPAAGGYTSSSQPPGYTPGGAAGGGYVNNPYAASQVGQGPPGYGAGAGYGGPVAPHRGGTILTLGILGLVVCAICGIFAWTMGSSDLKQMRAGRMDRSGEGITQAGMVCGIISTILLGLGIVIYIIIFAVVGVDAIR